MIHRLLLELGLGKWADILDGPLRASLFVLAAMFVLRVGRAVGRRVFGFAVRRQGEDGEARKRVETLTRIANYVFTVVIVALTTVTVLADFGISIAPFLATAGIAGVAIGFGAQSLVKDYFTGLVLLLENQIRLGDQVEAGGKSGTVEEVTLRYVRLRDYAGNVHFVPNGSIAGVTNKTREYAYAVLDLRVPYKYDVDAVMAQLREVTEELRAAPGFGPLILDALDVAGVEELGDASVLVRSRIKVSPQASAKVRREMLARIKLQLAKQGMALPAAPIAAEALQDAN